MKNKRIEYLDVCKGLLIILVVIGHAIEIVDIEKKSYLFKLIYSFHMPAFFMISGFLFNADKWKSKGFKEFLINRINKNLIPYFFFEYLYGFTASLFFYDLTWKGKIVELFYVIKGAFSVKVHYIPSWFLITLFFAAILVYWLDSRDWKRLMVEIIVLATVSIFGGHLLYNMDDGFVRDLLLFSSRITLSATFMMCGVLWRQLDLSKINKPLCVLGCLAVTLIFPLFFEWESISSFTIRYVAPFLLTGITGTCVIVTLSRYMNFRILKFLGRESLIIMGTHQAVRFAMLFRFPEFYESKYMVPVYLIGVIILEAIMIPVLNRYVPFLIEKKELPLLEKQHTKL